MGRIYLRKSVAIFVGLLLLCIGAASPAKAVMYGTEAPDGARLQPWAVSIWIAQTEAGYGTPTFTCSGALISSRVVLTAAHCIPDRGLMFVKVGATTLMQTATLVPVDAVWRHPRYSGRSAVNDVGLLRLESMPSPSTPISLASEAQAKQVSAMGSYRFYGWGLDQNGRSASYLRWATLNNQDKIAQTRLAKYGYSKTVNIAAGTYLSKEKVYKGICNGDSGGPLVSQLGGIEVVVGIASWSLDVNGSCDANSPSVFGRITYYSNEILAAIPTLETSAVYANRALPKEVAAGTFLGKVAVGEKVRCLQGTWSSNTAKVSTWWETSYGAILSNSEELTIPSSQEGATINCVALGTNANGSRKTSLSIKVNFRPQSAGALVISGVGSKAPTLGTKITCGGIQWPVGYEAGISWFVSDSAFFSPAPPEPVSVSPSLLLDSTSRKLILGKWLFCVSTAVGPGGVASVRTMVYIPKPVAPTVWPSVALSSTDISTNSVTYKCSSYGTSLAADVTTTYRWGLVRDVSSSQMYEELGQGEIITLSPEARNKYMNKLLACFATASNDAGSDTKSSVIYLPAYFLN